MQEHAIELANLDGRTPEEDLAYRIENRLPLRDEPMSEGEMDEGMMAILHNNQELFHLLADA